MTSHMILTQHSYETAEVTKAAEVQFSLLGPCQGLPYLFFYLTESSVVLLSFWIFFELILKPPKRYLVFQSGGWLAGRREYASCIVCYFSHYPKTWTCAGFCMICILFAWREFRKILIFFAFFLHIHSLKQIRKTWDMWKATFSKKICISRKWMFVLLEHLFWSPSGKRGGSIIGHQINSTSPELDGHGTCETNLKDE